HACRQTFSFHPCIRRPVDVPATIPNCNDRPAKAALPGKTPRAIFMKSPVFRSDRRSDTINALYGVIVAQARSPGFYRDYAVPDTVNGRLEMILLHVFLFFRRVRGEDESMRQTGQEVFDLFCRDMDNNLREMGVGDLSVPKRMRQIGEAFYGRAKAYDAALVAEQDTALTEALLRNVYSGAQQHAAAAQ